MIAETYEVTRLIGQGGMGAVWEATHRRLPGKRVAIKVLLNASTEGDALARFRREAEIASKLGHPNIVEVIDFHQLATGTPYMVLEFLEGDSLARRLKAGPMSLAQTIDIVRQVGSALHAAHCEGVVHRDLKPDNIFLTPSDAGGELTDRVKVLDFGISKIRGSNTVQTQESALLGTPQYMSPEQAFGKNKSIDQRTDIFALGAIVFEMLAGRPAFAGDTLAQVILAVVHEPTPSLAGVPGVPPHVAQAVEKAMQKEPEARFSEVHEMVAALSGRPMQTLDRRPIPTGVKQAFAATEAVGPASAGMRGEVVPPTMTQPASKAGLYAGVVGVVLALGGVGAFFVMHEKHPPATVGTPTVGTPTVGTPTPTVGTPTPTVATPTVATPTVATPTPTVATPTPTVATPTPGGKTPAKVKAESLPPSVVADLEAAEQSLSARNFDNAIHLARRTLTVQKSSRAQALIARVYCAQGDLGNAKAAFRSVGGADKALVIKTCKKNDIDLP